MVQKIQTRTNEPMCFVTFEDSTAQIELIVFPKIIKEFPNAWQVGKLLLIYGKINTKDNQVKLVVDRVKELEGRVEELEIKITDPLILQSVQKDDSGSINIFIPRGTTAEALNDIKIKLATNKGETPVLVYVPNGDSGPKKVKLPFGINYTKKLADDICKRLIKN